MDRNPGSGVGLGVLDLLEDIEVVIAQGQIRHDVFVPRMR